MPRNSSGTYTLPEAPFVPSTPISSAAVNSNNDDLADAMTDSLSRTGEGGMQAVLGLHIDGFNYTADTDTGISRTAANTQVIKCGGVDVVQVTPTGMSMLGSAIFPLPIGLGPLPWSGLTAPAGWVLVFGQTTLSRTTYAALWAFAQAEIAAGNTFYNIGNGSTTFGIGDMRGRIPAGKDNMGGVAAGRLTGISISPNGETLGGVGGGQAVTLTLAQLPTGITSSNASQSIDVATSSGVKLPGLDSSNSWNALLDQTSGTGAFFARAATSGNCTNVTGMSGSNSISVTSNNTGGGTHTNVQPTIITNYIIYAGV